MPDPPLQSAEVGTLRELLADQLREVVLDALRERQPEGQDPDDGVDEWTDDEYLALADASLATINMQALDAWLAVSMLCYHGHHVTLRGVGTHGYELDVVVSGPKVGSKRGSESTVENWLIDLAREVSQPDGDAR